MTDGRDETLTFETILDAPAETVWRALTIPEHLADWLMLPQDSDGLGVSNEAERIDLTLVAQEPNRWIVYRWREAGEGALTEGAESLVTFELDPLADAQTRFRLTHTAAVRAANDNGAQTMMLAA